MPDIGPDINRFVREMWNSTKPHDQWIVEICDDHLIVTSDNDRTYAKVPFLVGETVEFGDPVPVRLDYVAAARTQPPDRVVFASRAESRPDPEPAPDPNDSPPAPVPAAPVTPAAEPEPHPQLEEDPVSLSEIRSRLGLPEDATEDALLAALDDVLDKATAPAEPVAAAALPPGVVTIEASVLDELRQGAAAGREAMERQRTQDRDQFIAAAVSAGKFAPARVEHWTRAYNADPEGTRQVIDGLAEGLVVPVQAAGYTGSPDPKSEDDEYAAMVAALDGPMGGNR